MMKKIGIMCLSLLIGFMTLGAEEFNVVGTGAGMNILEEIAMDFMKVNPGTTILVPDSIGSGGGVLSVGSDQETLGRIARGVKEKEEKYGLSFIEIARVPIVFFSHKDINLSSLTSNQILDIYQGKIKNWSEVGGPNRPIEVVQREKGDSSLDVLEKTLTGFTGDSIRTDATTKYSDQDNLDYILQTPGTIGFGTLGNGLSVDVNIFSIDSHEPDAKEYPYTGFLALIYKEGNLPSGAKLFLDYAISANAHAAIKRAHATPSRE